ncbi:chymotrypsin BI-like [Leguminivora glycinivorella]|uniref:chymotrypsin BI-like n=1 Tax=Leguminivora glycinivorella TaxID=1035111 RepID=UPI00200D9EE0|nr:chymotrypsin BI-like [Leguminivora glycinivorella]
MQHRHLVLLNIRFWNPHEYSKCTGSIISNKWIITAAHCVNKDGIMSVFVRQFNKERNRILTHVGPYNFYIHPSFKNLNFDDASSVENDIALLKAPKRIIFDYNVSPIELAQVSPQIGDSVIMAGHGMNEISNKDPVLPRQGEGILVRCPKELDNMLCVYNHTTPWYGDSGGPLTHNGKLVGIVSGGSGPGCDDDYPKSLCLQRYSKIAYHYNWIFNVIANN